jgi:predicted deacylase
VRGHALEAVQPLLAPHAGVLLYRKALGERVEAGDRDRRIDRSGQRR